MFRGLTIIVLVTAVSIAATIPARRANAVRTPAPTVSVTPTPAPTPTQEENKDAILRVIKGQQLAWNRGDIDGFMEGYWRSHDTVFVSGDDVTRGWQTVRDRYHSKYSDREKMGQLTFSELEVHMFGYDGALVFGRWQLDRAGDKPHGRFTLIFRKTRDGWKIVHDHTSAAVDG